MTIRILIVDDEEVFAKNWVKLLSRRGYDATYVLTGSDALAAIGEKIFDVILLDLKMPGMGGLETCKKIVKRDANAMVIVITAHGALDEAFEAIKIGAYGLLHKPFAIDELVAHIEEVNNYSNYAAAKPTSRRRCLEKLYE
jgi:DNA-binding NtrC family response regulator